MDGLAAVAALSHAVPGYRTLILTTSGRPATRTGPWTSRYRAEVELPLTRRRRGFRLAGTARDQVATSQDGRWP